MLTRKIWSNFRIKRSYPAILTVGFLLLTACGSLPSISTQVSYCCRPVAERVHSYRIEFKDMPEFLKPMLRDEASIVLASKGLDYTEGSADAILTMSFVHTPLSSDATSAGESAEPPAGVVSRFDAEVRVEMQHSVTREVVSSGSLSRIHNATADAYMHEMPARDAMRKAFTALFADYPDPVLDEF